MRPSTQAWLLVVCFLAAMLLVLVIVFRSPEKPTAHSPSSLSTPPVDTAHKTAKTSPLANSSTEFVGTQACAKCHMAEHQSYMGTGHSRSMSEVHAESEPPDVAFHHSPSGRDYVVRREASQLFHAETLETGRDGSPIISAYPVRYLVGSGRHTRTYLVEDSGFLAESPITWYASQQKWDMSPGYDRAAHFGFERAADLGCLICHVGQVEARRDSMVRIVEPAIGCERCHGPGASHVEQRTREKKLEGGHDPTIIRPDRLSRDLAESVCAECHLRGDATVAVPGRRVTDFRPGEPLSEFRIDYQLKVDNKPMKVVGHVEQMRLSRCYQASPELTCTTCHDPHTAVAETERVSFYRARCLECHADSCKLPPNERLEQSPQDNCVTCHMPQSPTDIVHVAFTHHRIGIHRGGELDAPNSAVGQLVAMQEPVKFSEADRDRCLGLAYLELSDLANDEHVSRYRKMAFDLLQKSARAGASDGEMLAGLARMYWEMDSPYATDVAYRAMEDKQISVRASTNALLVLGEMNYRRGDFVAAQVPLEKLTRIRRHPEDWFLLGMTQAELGKLVESEQSLRRAVAISPFRADIREGLAKVYRRAGNRPAAAEQEQIARQLSARKQ